MKYCMLTELDILTPSITEQINLILSAEYEHLQTVTSEYSENEPSELNHKYLLLPECQDTVDLYWQLKKKMVDHFAGQELFNFKIHQMHQALEEEYLIDCLQRLEICQCHHMFEYRQCPMGTICFPTKTQEIPIVEIRPLH